MHQMRISTTQVSSVMLRLKKLETKFFVIQPSFRQNAVWCVSYQLELGLIAGVTGRQGMLTPPRHLIPPLVYPEVRVCPIPKFVLPTGHEIDDCSLFMSFYQCNLQNPDFKDIGSILFLKNGLKKIWWKNYKNHFRSNNYEVCTAVALCFPNILYVMVLENINLSSDRIRATVIVV
jgi:hypothetical protein